MRLIDIAELQNFFYSAFIKSVKPQNWRQIDDQSLISGQMKYLLK